MLTSWPIVKSEGEIPGAEAAAATEAAVIDIEIVYWFEDERDPSSGQGGMGCRLLQGGPGD